MPEKLLNFDDFAKRKLKDSEFRKYFEEEGKKLAIGYKIAQLREKLGITQKQLAEKIQTSQTVISRLESGDYWQCSLKTLEKIALATGTHLIVQFKR